MSSLPNLLGIGVQKAGTNSLYTILKKHPAIAVSHETEVHFFDLDRKYNKGKDWYKAQFPKINSEKYLSEITPEYVYSKKVPERIQETLGNDLKFILMLRHPVDRAYSHYTMNKMGGIENRTFEEALKEEASSAGNKKYIQKSLYGKQLSNFLKYYSLDQIHIILFNEFTTDQNRSVSKLWKFLEVEPIKLDREVHRNQSGSVKYSSLRWIYRNNRFLDPLKDMLHNFPSVRNYIKSMLEDKPDKLSAEQRDKYFGQYFYEDIKNLELLIEQKLEHWYTHKI